MNDRERVTVPLWPDAANLLGVSRTTVYRLAHGGLVPGAFKVGHRWRVRVQQLTDFLDGSNVTVGGKETNTPAGSDTAR